MCGACGVLMGGDNWDGELISDSQIRRMRLIRLAYLKKLLKASLVAIDDCHGQQFQLTGPTGKRALVSGIGAIWPAIEEVGGKPLDPLDVNYADRLGV